MNANEYRCNSSDALPQPVPLERDSKAKSSIDSLLLVFIPQIRWLCRWILYDPFAFTVSLKI
jgi:hypothetical protein